MHSLLGIQSSVPGQVQAADLAPQWQQNIHHQMMRLLDRFGVLESNVNWRLYGLPPKLCNIKLEQAGLVAGSGDVERSLEELRKLLVPVVEDDVLAIAKGRSFNNAFVIAGDDNVEFRAFKRAAGSKTSFTVVDDTSDLMRSEAMDLKGEESPTVVILKMDGANAFARMIQPEFDFIWLSSLLERLSPLQSSIVLQRSRRGLKSGGVIAGFFADFAIEDPGRYWLDPRRLRPVTKKFIESLAMSAGFTKVSFSSANQSPGRIVFEIA